MRVCVYLQSFLKKYSAKMYKLLIFLILSLACFTAQQIPLPNNELEYCFACLKEENIKCKEGSTPEQIAQFIKDENCWYQYYMDKLQELDCVLQENFKQQSPSAEDIFEAELQAQMMEIRNKFYNTTQVLEEKICNDCTKNDLFTKYAQCMKDYWGNMKTMAETEIKANKHTESSDMYKRCDTLGQKHQYFCAKKPYKLLH